MENASKALLMAAGVLMGILIISLAVFLFVTFGATSAESHKQIEQSRIDEFNSQFLKYQGKDDLTIYNVITVANSATSNNEYYELPKVTSIINNDNYPDYYIQVILKNDNYNNIRIEGAYGSSPSVSYEELIDKDVQKINNTQNYLKTYTCKVSVSNTTKRVYKVIFIQK